MDNLGLGKLITTEQQRDAIHIAVAPVTAYAVVQPGQHVDAQGGPGLPYVGIVDPYLRQDVHPGDSYWLFLYPNTVTSLRHEWTHPAFTSEVQSPESTATRYAGSEIRAESEKWLREYAKRLKPYESVEEAYKNLIEELKVKELHGHGTDLYTLSDVEDADELERHAEIVLGKRIDLTKFEFSCAC